MGTSNGSSQNGNSNTAAPFLNKTYEMVDDPSTDRIVSWTETGTSFVVWNATDLSRYLLPKYFKHNNFSSFIRQLNTYGFRKVNPEQWEFATDGFYKGDKDSLRSIRRRKPSASSHSNSNATSEVEQSKQPDTVTCTDPTHSGYLDYIQRLEHDRNILLSELMKLQHRQKYTESGLQVLGHRVHVLEKRQHRMVSFFSQAMRTQESFALLQQLEDQMLFQSKKRQKLLLSEEASTRICESSDDHDFTGNLTTEIDGLLSLTTESRGDLSSAPILSVSLNQTDDESVPSLSSGGISNTPTTDYSNHSVPDATTLQFSNDNRDTMSQPSPIWDPEEHEPAWNTSVSREHEVALDTSVSNEIEHLNVSTVIEHLVQKDPRSSQNEATEIQVRAFQHKDEVALNTSVSNEFEHLVQIDSRSSQNEITEIQVPGSRPNDGFWSKFLTERPGSTEADSDFETDYEFIDGEGNSLEREIL